MRSAGVWRSCLKVAPEAWQWYESTVSPLASTWAASSKSRARRQIVDEEMTAVRVQGTHAEELQPQPQAGVAHGFVEAPQPLHRQRPGRVEWQLGTHRYSRPGDRAAPGYRLTGACREVRQRCLDVLPRLEQGEPHQAADSAGLDAHAGEERGYRAAVLLIRLGFGDGEIYGSVAVLGCELCLFDERERVAVELRSVQRRTNACGHRWSFPSVWQ